MSAGGDGRVQPFSEEHLDAAAALYVGVFNAPPWDDAWTAETSRRRLAEALAAPGALGLVLHADRLLGFALGAVEPWFDGEHFYLKELCVRSDRQRAGLGTRLMRHLERELRERDIDRIYLLTAADGPAARFYETLGYYRSPRVALMARRLDGS